MLLLSGLLFSEYEGTPTFLLWVTWVRVLYISAGGLLHPPIRKCLAFWNRGKISDATLCMISFVLLSMSDWQIVTTLYVLFHDFKAHDFLFRNTPKLTSIWLCNQ